MKKIKIAQDQIALRCIPIIKEVVCASGRKCFHDIHYLFEFDTAAPIPADACPLDCIANSLVIFGVTAPVPPGVLPPRRVGNCIVFTVQYRVRVFFEYFNAAIGSLDVGTTVGVFSRELAVPVQTFNGGCRLCEPEENDFCIRRINFNCIRAVLVPRPAGFPSTFPPFAIEVTVEKEFFALESGRSIICIPACVEDCIELPPPVLPGECVPFEKPGTCPSFCQETDLEPGKCSQCPPPQISSTTSSTSSTSSTSTTTSTTSTSTTTTAAGVCECFVTGGGTSTLPNDAFPESAQGEEASLGFNACPGCNFNANTTFSTMIDGETQNLQAPDLISLDCTATTALIVGSGDFGTGSDRVDVTYTLTVNEATNTYRLEIRDLANVLVFSTGANAVALTGQGVNIRECPLGPNNLTVRYTTADKYNEKYVR